ncbi:helix-turn-helix transcriptional regulator [Nocardioides donggukensis]|uniref:AAA family ATPase n=1 Tax=Nocardioides donggukensis TaxID=2774019 RepID=A0A927K3D9_9ACTN|nr:LuxR family transcriptional regulator [Nocardioides donggukensis]MBD8869862.1 AAA family ATPase [Nocardioides donggukensis]
MEPRSPVVGRDAERELLVSALHDSATGTPRAVLVAGEAGIGKTRLVADVADDAAADGHLVLWGRCLRFAADSSPFLPIGQVLTHWHRQAAPDERGRVLDGAQDLAAIAPALGSAPGSSQTQRLVMLVATVLERITEQTPLVLVVDDLQWADTTSLDVLAFLIGGFGPGVRISVLGTYRDTDLEDGHRLHGWLADMRRMPGVEPIRLDRLDLLDTDHLVSALQGAGGSARQAAALFARAKGNPYLTEVLLRAEGTAGSLTGGARELPEVLLASWHRLSPEARALMQWIAVGGRPVELGVLERLARGRDLSVSRVRTCLEEARAEGIVRLTPTGDVWFHHPLLAEVIGGTVAPSDLRRLHGEYIEILEDAGSVPEHSRATHLALHHAAAGNTDEALRWSLRAAAAALELRALAEEAEHLQRACRLWPDAGPDARAEAGDLVQLLIRASDSARCSGADVAAVRLREQALSLVDQHEEPELAVKLRLPLTWLRIVSGLDLEPWPRVEPVAETLALVRDRPASPEKARALSALALVLMWFDDPDAPVLSEESVRMARSVGSPSAVAGALAIRAQIRAGTPEGLADAEEALDLAWQVGDPRQIGLVAVWHAHALASLGRLADATDRSLAAFGRMLDRGWFHDAAYGIGADPARWLCELGRWTEAGAHLRVLMSRRQAPGPAATARGVAAILAYRSGDLPTARAHMARARELSPGFPTEDEPDRRAALEEARSEGDNEGVLYLVESWMPHTLEPELQWTGELLLRAARAAGDVAAQPGRRASVAAQLARIEELAGDRAREIRDCAGDDPMLRAVGRLYLAESARCRDDRGRVVEQWVTAVEACRAAHLRWDEALATYRLGEALLTRGGSRARAAESLRTAAALAAEMGAAPLLDDVRALAGQAHVSLDQPGADLDAAADAWPHLTAREKEVLAHLGAGRTYAEIADALVISPKTVSVHVSNLLRKTGTTSRIELTDLARRRASGTVPRQRTRTAERRAGSP